MASSTPLEGQPLQGLGDVTNQQYALGDMGWKERRKRVDAERLDRILTGGVAEADDADIDLTGAWHAYRDRWHRIDLGLRPLYNNNARAYYRDFRRIPQVMDTILKSGMQAYTIASQRLEKAALRKDTTKSYVTAGIAVLDDFVRSLARSSPPTNTDTDVIFVSINFEGDAHSPRGVRGFGATECDPRLFCTSDRPTLQTHNFKLRQRSKQNFVFGETTRVDGDDVRQAVINTVTNTTNSDRRKIVLVGHGLISSELAILKSLNISVEDLNVIGLVDTSGLAQDVLGTKGTLESLLQRLQIDYAKSTLHCAGNDAYYTMQALLVLLEISYFKKHQEESREGFVKVIELARRPIPQRCQDPRKAEGARDQPESSCRRPKGQQSA